MARPSNPPEGVKQVNSRGSIHIGEMYAKREVQYRVLPLEGPSGEWGAPPQVTVLESLQAIQDEPVEIGPEDAGVYTKDPQSTALQDEIARIAAETKKREKQMVNGRRQVE